MKTIAITGANRGIGLELTRAYRARGDQVVAFCRRTSPELDATGARVEEGVDVTHEEGRTVALRRLEGTRLDLLVNNAGILEGDRLPNVGHESLLRQMEVNAFGPLLLTQALLPNLASKAKVVVITSRMGSIGDNQSGGYYGYRMSKAAVNAAFVSLAKDLASKGIPVGILHPGMVATAMTGGQGIATTESVRGLLARIDELDMAKSGRFFHQNGDELPW